MSVITLTEDQSCGRDKVLTRWAHGYPYSVISGYAGTGKSTLIKYIIDEMGYEEDEVAFATPTGKAAQVLMSMGNKNVSTIHKLLYDWFPQKDGTFYRKRKDYLPYEIIICDEVSMIPRDMIEELLRHDECHIIFCGDPGQLPPINPENDNHLLDNPHVFLSEIVRQSYDSDIIKLSLDIRNGRPLITHNGNDVLILDKSKLTNSMIKWAEEIICATNETRHRFNNLANRVRGFDPEDVVDGQQIICLRNYWDIISVEKREPLINGTIGTIKNARTEYKKIPPSLGGFKFPVVTCDLITNAGETYKNLSFDKQQIVTGEAREEFRNFAFLKAVNRFYKSEWAVEKGLLNPIPLEANFGYAITCHKAQGSTFEKVIVWEESFPKDKEEHKHWLYTGVTRPSNKLLLFRNE